MATTVNNVKPMKLEIVENGDSVYYKKIEVNEEKVWSSESDLITLTGTVKQGSGSLNWKDVDFLIEEDWEKLTVQDSKWGKSYGSFETHLQLIDGATKTNLVSRTGAYGGHTMAEEVIVASGATFSVKKGQTIRLRVGASYDKNVSGQHETTSWISFILS